MSAPSWSDLEALFHGPQHRVRLEPQGSPRLLPKAVARRRQRDVASGIDAGQSGFGNVATHAVTASPVTIILNWTAGLTK
jgi:hypothetical protein